MAEQLGKLILYILIALGIGFFILGVQKIWTRINNALEIVFGKRFSFYPTVSEDRLFIMALTVLLVLVLLELPRLVGIPVPLSRIDQDALLITAAYVVPLLYALPFAAVGFILVFYHAFSKKEKKTWHKTALIGFVVVFEFAIAVMAGLEVLTGISAGWLAVFPLWNMGHALILMAAWFLARQRQGYNTHHLVDTKEITTRDIIIDSVFAALLLPVLLFVFSYGWGIAISATVTLAIVGKNSISSFEKRISKTWRRNRIPKQNRTK